MLAMSALSPGELQRDFRVSAAWILASQVRECLPVYEQGDQDVASGLKGYRCSMFSP